MPLTPTSIKNTGPSFNFRVCLSESWGPWPPPESPDWPPLTASCWEFWVWWTDALLGLMLKTGCDCGIWLCWHFTAEWCEGGWVMAGVEPCVPTGGSSACWCILCVCQAAFTWGGMATLHSLRGGAGRGGAAEEVASSQYSSARHQTNKRKMRALSVMLMQQRSLNDMKRLLQSLLLPPDQTSNQKET